MTSDEENHLNLLSIFHYVMGGLTGLFSCFPLIHVAMGIALATGALEPDAISDDEAAKMMGFIFAGIGAIFILLGWSLAIAIIIAGKKLKRRRAHTYCIVVAALECLFMPFGTILGVFTLIMLTKESVKTDFEHSPH